ncbi:MAG: gamma-glutamyl-gamma-aminobutyrate hydrolase family protein [Flavobacteriales bacterium]|nr:gamma-glutamyl-gamma-aminobutyrate hydrolase family protein [Flavobacteriales bacterium]
MDESELRIGITMRITEANSYPEPRDSVAQDWINYMHFLLPNASWMYIPNMGSDAVAFIQKWGINSFILTGGDNLGDYPIRDITETTILKYAIKNSLPVLGICRGLQLIYNYLGGTVEKQSLEFAQIHVAKQHKINLLDEIRIVNSYHNNKLLPETIPSKLSAIAHCLEDYTIEAVQGDNLLGIMWHPERTHPYQTWTAELIHKLFRIL